MTDTDRSPLLDFLDSIGIDTHVCGSATVDERYGRIDDDGTGWGSIDDDGTGWGSGSGYGSGRGNGYGSVHNIWTDDEFHVELRRRGIRR